MPWSTRLSSRTAKQTGALARPPTGEFIPISAEIQEEFLTVPETALFLRVSEVTLARWRTEGSGPRFAKFGRRVVYDRFDVVTWTEAQKRTSTSAGPSD
ncbi:helix-turn-helix transcriptional regulator [Bauldia litoralis]|uniref:helix-turn-helix transcriptional regulator n=1 Tax=Bauldia litoralis TaxID=665467 RepID=UPI003CC7AD04